MAGRKTPTPWEISCEGSDWGDELLDRNPVTGRWPAYLMAERMLEPQKRPTTGDLRPKAQEQPLPVVEAIPNNKRRLDDIPPNWKETMYMGRGMDVSKPEKTITGLELEIERLKNQNKRLRNDWRNSRNETYNAKRNLRQLEIDFAISLDENDVLKVQLSQRDEALDRMQVRLDRLRGTVDLTNDDEGNETGDDEGEVTVTDDEFPVTDDLNAQFPPTSAEKFNL